MVMAAPSTEGRVIQIIGTVIDVEFPPEHLPASNNAVNILREQQVKYNDVARAAADGDVVVVNYTATSEGKPLTDFAPTARGLTEKQGFWLAIAKESFIPGFTEQLVGASAGYKRTVTITFPADFVSKELSGRTAEYAVEVTLVKEKILPEVNQAFAESFGAGTVDQRAWS